MLVLVPKGKTYLRANPGGLHSECVFSKGLKIYMIGRGNNMLEVHIFVSLSKSKLTCGSSLLPTNISTSTFVIYRVHYKLSRFAKMP